MREFTKSLGSLTLSMSVLGAQQLLNLLRQPIPGPEAAGALDAVASAADEQLGGYLRNLQAAGDRVQRSAVDVAFGLGTLQVLDPRKLLTLSSEVLRDSTAAARQLIPGSVRPADAPEPATDGEPCGWGPMPR